MERCSIHSFWYQYCPHLIHHCRKQFSIHLATHPTSIPRKLQCSVSYTGCSMDALESFDGHLFFSWFTEGLEIPPGFPSLPDLMDTSPIVVETAASPATHIATVSAPTIPLPTTIDNHTDPETYINPEHICSSYTKPCLPFPKPQDIGIQMARAELLDTSMIFRNKLSKG
ncbi:hypothetical protein QX201_004103 [Fusarium graminearum]